MHIKDAILKAADHIERRPECYSFSSAVVTRNDDEYGCMLARIGQYLDVGYASADNVALDELNMTLNEFFLAIWNLMDRAPVAVCVTNPFTFPVIGAFSSAPSVAAALRRFAQRYDLPESVRAILAPVPAPTMAAINKATINVTVLA